MITGERNEVTSWSRGRIYSLHVRTPQIQTKLSKYGHRLRTDLADVGNELAVGSGGASLPAYASLLLHDILEAIAYCGSQKTGLGAADEAGQAGGARVGWRADRVRLTFCTV